MLAVRKLSVSPGPFLIKIFGIGPILYLRRICTSLIFILPALADKPGRRGHFFCSRYSITLSIICLHQNRLPFGSVFTLSSPRQSLSRRGAFSHALPFYFEYTPFTFENWQTQREQIGLKTGHIIWVIVPKKYL